MSKMYVGVTIFENKETVPPQYLCVKNFAKFYEKCYTRYRGVDRTELRNKNNRGIAREINMNKFQRLKYTRLVKIF